MISRQEVIEIVKNTKKIKMYCFFKMHKVVSLGFQLNDFCRDIEAKNTEYLDDEELIRFVHILQKEQDLLLGVPHSSRIKALYKLEDLLGPNVSWALRSLYNNRKQGDFTDRNILAVIRHPEPKALVMAFEQLNIRINTGKGLAGNYGIELPSYFAILEEMRTHPNPEEFIGSKTKEIYDFYTMRCENARSVRL